MSDKLEQRVRETKVWMDDNCDSDDGYEFTEDGALEALMGECGEDSQGYCSLAGTEYCEFECPFRDMDEMDDDE